MTRRRAPLAQPPFDELTEAELAIGRKRLEPKPLPLGLPLQVRRKPLRFGLGGRGGRDVLQTQIYFL